MIYLFYIDGILYVEVVVVYNKKEKKKVQKNMQVIVVDEKDDELSKVKVEMQCYQNWGDEKLLCVVVNGMDLLDNNDVNFIMVVMMSVGVMFVVSWYWDIFI